MLDNEIDNEFIIELWETIEKYIPAKFRVQCIKDILEFLENRGIDVESIVSDLFNYSLVMDKAVEAFLKERENIDIPSDE